MPPGSAAPTAAPSGAPSGVLPAATRADVDRLRGMLASLRRQARGWIWVESISWLVIAVAAFFWMSLAIDWFVEPPRFVRAALLASGAVVLTLILARKLWARLATRLADESLAVLVERSHPAFRDSLTTAIELAERHGAEIDTGLLSRTAAAAGARLDEVRPGLVFRRRRLVTLALAAAAAAASIAVLAWSRPATAGMWVDRLVFLREQPWPRRVRLTVADFPGGVRKVARGTDVDVVVVASSADRLPAVVDLRWKAAGAAPPSVASGLRGAWRTDRMGARGGETDEGQAFGHVLKGVSESLDLEVRGGDARLRNLRLEVLEPPGLESLRITATPPAYLGGGAREVPSSRVVQVPRGSTVEIACTATKPLGAATMILVEGGRAPWSAGTGEEVLATLPADGGRALVGRIVPLDGDRTVAVRFTDTDGLDNREPVTFTLAAQPDQPPELAVRLQGISTAVTSRARLPLVGTVSDDHALAGVAVRMQVVDGAVTTFPVSRVRAGDAFVTLPDTAAEIVPVEPLGLAVGQRLDVSVTAADTCTLQGGPNTASSDTWSLDVVAPEALVAMLEAREIVLRRRYESCIADLSQARDALAAEAEGTAAPRTDDAAGPAAAARLGEATSRAAGETRELAEAFRAIRLEFDNNQLLTPELEARLIAQIADPLAALAAEHLPALAAGCRGPLPPRELVRRADAVLARMRAVLDKMMELESFNEVLEMLRGMIRSQEQIRADTLEQQKRRAREALERP